MKKKTSNLAIAICLTLTAALWGAFVFPKHRAKEAHEECMQTLRNTGTALEMYSCDYGGRYPKELGHLTPNYLRTLPRCPSNDSVYGYEVFH